MSYQRRYAEVFSGSAASYVYTDYRSSEPNEQQDKLIAQMFNKLHQPKMIGVQPTQPVCDLTSARSVGGFQVPRLPTISMYTTGTLSTLNTTPDEFTNVQAYATAIPYRPYMYLEATNLGHYAYINQAAETGYVWRHCNKSEMYLTSTLSTSEDTSISEYIFKASGSAQFSTRDSENGSNFNVFTMPNIAFEGIQDHGVGWYYYHAFVYNMYGLNLGGVFGTTSADTWSYNFTFAKFTINDKPIYNQWINTPDYAEMTYFNKLSRDDQSRKATGIGLDTGAALAARLKFFDGSLENPDQFLSATINSVHMDASFQPQGTQFNSLYTQAVNVFPYVYHRHVSDGMLDTEALQEILDAGAFPYVVGG